MFLKPQLEKKQFEKSDRTKGANKHRRFSFTKGKRRQKLQEIEQRKKDQERRK